MSRPRSPKAHKHFFAILQKAFENWPESHPFVPDNAEHLRAWLQVRAGHRDVMVAEPDQTMTEFIIAVMKHMQAMPAGFRYAFPAERGGMTMVAFPRSISWGEMGQEAFGPLANDMFALIEEIIGVDIGTIESKLGETT